MQKHYRRLQREQAFLKVRIDRIHRLTSDTSYRDGLQACFDANARLLNLMETEMRSVERTLALDEVRYADATLEIQGRMISLIEYSGSPRFGE